MEQPHFHPLAAPLQSRLANVFSNPGQLFLFLTILLGVSGLSSAASSLSAVTTFSIGTKPTMRARRPPRRTATDSIRMLSDTSAFRTWAASAMSFTYMSSPTSSSAQASSGCASCPFSVGLSAIAGLFVLARKWYGSATGFAALALTPSLLIFQLSNTIRFDVFAIAFVAWALVFYSYAVQRHASIVLHVAVGFVLALGLQVHLHTAAAAFAVGCAYLVSDIRAVRHRTPSRRPALMPVLGFVAGYAIGAMLFVVLNVLPNPHAYFRTAALARLSAADSAKELNLTAPMDASRPAQTFLSPTTIVTKGSRALPERCR